MHLHRLMKCCFHGQNVPIIKIMNCNWLFPLSHFKFAKLIFFITRNCRSAYLPTGAWYMSGGIYAVVFMWSDIANSAIVRTATAHNWPLIIDVELSLPAGVYHDIVSDDSNCGNFLVKFRPSQYVLTSWRDGFFVV